MFALCNAPCMYVYISNELTSRAGLDGQCKQVPPIGIHDEDADGQKSFKFAMPIKASSWTQRVCGDQKALCHGCTTGPSVRP